MQPTAKQLRYLRDLAQLTATTFTPPTTKAQASREIQRLKTQPASTRADRAPERNQVQDDLQRGRGDAVRHCPGETSGYGQRPLGPRQHPGGGTMTPAGRRVQLARYQISTGTRGLYAQRIDVPIDHPDRVHLVERQSTPRPSSPSSPPPSSSTASRPTGRPSSLNATAWTAGPRRCDARPRAPQQRAARRRRRPVYAEHCDRLHTTITRRVHAPTATIEDACQTAWSTLLRRPDIDLDQRGLNWLTTVATREAWRQGSTARELPAGAFIAADLATGAGELPEPAGPAGDPADLALARDEHNQRVRQLLALKPREREALYLQGLGHSYHAIAELSGVVGCHRRLPCGAVR